MKVLRFLFLNRFVKSQLNNFPFKYFGLNKRLKAMMLELHYSLSVFIPYAFPIGMISIISKPAPILGQPYEEYFGFWDIVSLSLFSLLTLTLLNKDFFNGQSVVNRLLGYQVIDVKTSLPANEMKCMLRNVTMPIWPVEGIFALVYPQRRLGDFLAGTKLKVVETSEPEKIFGEIKAKNFDKRTGLTLFLSIVVIGIYEILFDPRIGIL